MKETKCDICGKDLPNEGITITWSTDFSSCTVLGGASLRFAIEEKANNIVKDITSGLDLCYECELKLYYKVLKLFTDVKEERAEEMKGEKR